jgi:Cdc6-like AAA superfamily ATPase
MASHGVTSSIGGLVQLADLVVNKTWPFLKEIKNQRYEISKLSSEIASLAGILHSLRLISENSTVPIDPNHILECQKILEELRDRLKSTNTEPSRKQDQVKSFVDRLSFPFQKLEMENINKRLEPLKTTFVVALSSKSIADHIDLTADIKTIKEELLRRRELESRIELDEHQTKVIEYFNAASPKENHAMSLKLRHEGTGLWLLHETNFKDWLQNFDSHIWLYGIPGAGKTVLSSLLIDKVLEARKPSEAVAYFYCDYKDATKQDPCYILASIAAQLAVRDEKAFGILDAGYQECFLTTKNVKNIKAGRLSELLEKQLRHFSLTTIVLDGLDECGNNTATVLDHLLSLAKEFKFSLRLAILSRDEVFIRQRLEKDNFKSICIAATSLDIRLYAASELEFRIRSRRLFVETPSTTEEILQKLIEKAQGM